MPLAGFVTEELREGGQCVGFGVETFDGDRAVLAHVELPGPPRVGKYGIDLPAFERVALPGLASPPDEGVVLIDELEKMELASEAFRDAFSELFEQPVAVGCDGARAPPTVHRRTETPAGRGARPRDRAKPRRAACAAYRPAGRTMRGKHDACPSRSPSEARAPP